MVNDIWQAIYMLFSCMAGIAAKMAIEAIKRAWRLKKLRPLTPIIKCPQCGSRVEPGAAFCSSCGYPLNDEAYMEGKARAVVKAANEKLARTSPKARALAQNLAQNALPERGGNPGSHTLITRYVVNVTESVAEATGVGQITERFGVLPPDPRDVECAEWAYIAGAYAEMAVEAHRAKRRNRELEAEVAELRAKLREAEEELKELRPLRRWLAKLEKLEEMGGEDYVEF
ncbi:MAG: hypothetical protein DRN91_07890 [Candidatus Alkanophagales archaeon]|nr:MAG: hypothetical protein DRN91_07890 [Candidatus Alkanophagales archaeon]